MAQHPEFATRDLSSIRVLSCGGAPVPEALIKIYGARGLPFNQGYGLTETSPFASFLPSSMASEKLGSAGIAPFFTDVKVVDADGHDVPDGERGEIVVRGPNVMKGYWNRPDATAEVLIDGWFHTGDVGIRDADGYFFIVDRKKDMINTGGFKVFPAEIERVIAAHPSVAMVAVGGLSDELKGEIAKAYVVLKPGATPDAEGIMALCRAELAAYKAPRAIQFVADLPKTSTGKIMRRELRKLDG
jgi:acyl-CoA synthetase (AMP-forming)/AMP-acid ligase II